MTRLFKSIAALLLLLNAAGGFGQKKKSLTTNDYGRWYHFYQNALSPDGKWATYIVQNPTGRDTLVLCATDMRQKHIFMGGKQGAFSPDARLYAFLNGDDLQLLDLTSGRRDSIAGVTHYRFSKKGKYVIAEGRKDANELQLICLGRKEPYKVTGVIEYTLSPDGTALAIIQQQGNGNRVQYIHLDQPEQAIKIAQSPKQFSNLAFNTKGDGLAYLERLTQEEGSAADHRLYHASLKAKKGKAEVRELPTVGIPNAFQVHTSRLFYSSDGAQLFFDAVPTEKGLRSVSVPEVWSSTAKVLPPLDPGHQVHRHLMCWNIRSNRVVSVTDTTHSIGMPSSRGKHALLINPNSYLPHFDHGGIYADLYIKDLHTGEKRRIAQKVAQQKNHIQISPGGKYITWFADEEWQLYDFDAGKSICISCGIDGHFEDPGHDYPGQKYPNAKPYWTIGDKGVLLSDTHDIWLISPDGHTKNRLTDGKPANSMFRIYDEGFYRGLRDHFISYATLDFNHPEGILLKETNLENLEEGFGISRADTPFKRIMLTDDKVSSIIRQADTYLYTLRDFDKPPELMVHTEKQDKARVIQRSNEHQKEYHWGKSTLIQYNVEGISLKGALFYPAAYDPKKKYPMIVRVYQKLSSDLRNYVPPDQTSGIGFNVTCLTAAGYFVLYPDIHYTLNETGASALKCVMAAVDQAVSSASVDRQNVGLFGHSFGGFEVSYMMTQTNRFKTAVSGAGWHDLVGTYLGTDDSNMSSMWRFDTQQLRISDPFYSKAFLDNSPIMHAAGIDNPMLLWAGKLDSRISWENSSKMQMALWRLGKNSTFLIYPDEQHFMTNVENQIDLNRKTLEWYDYYLKGVEKPSWIE